MVGWYDTKSEPLKLKNKYIFHMWACCVTLYDNLMTGGKGLVGWGGGALTCARQRQALC